jgi:glyoxylase-like metal-dependent hydrolase (beta-lactamase superfamily II)
MGLESRWILQTTTEKVAMNIDRRSFVRRTGLTGLSLLALGLETRRAAADPDPVPGAKPTSSGTDSVAEPEILQFRLGELDAFIVHDGFLALPSVQPMFVPEARPAQIEELLKRQFLPPNRAALSLNVLGVKTKSGIILFDSGAGHEFGAAMGHLVRGLAKLAIQPAEVKTIFVTHAHADHVGGLVNESNEPIFSSARIVAARKEVEFWTSSTPDLSGMKTPPETKKQSLSTIQKLLGGVKNNLDLRDPGRVSPEVEIVAAPGHTPGHSYFLVNGGEEKLLVFGDAVHLHALQFPHPEWTMAYDVRPDEAIKTRRKLFEQASAERTLLLGYHMPFPGLGHVKVDGSGYAWVPRPWVV